MSRASWLDEQAVARYLFKCGASSEIVDKVCIGKFSVCFKLLTKCFVCVAEMILGWKKSLH